MTFPLTGTLALQAGQVRDAVLFAIGEANEKGGVAGYRLARPDFDDASPTTGQYDPALAATNARKLLQDASVIAAVGPLNSGSAKAVEPDLQPRRHGDDQRQCDQSRPDRSEVRARSIAPPVRRSSSAP